MEKESRMILFADGKITDSKIAASAAVNASKCLIRGVQIISCDMVRKNQEEGVLSSVCPYSLCPWNDDGAALHLTSKICIIFIPALTSSSALSSALFFAQRLLLL